jgi:poly(hydroxyalkanoate) granule-associated protein
MARKTPESPEDTPPHPFDPGNLAAQVRDSAQQIWLAGMGAFAKAQAEGRQVFETLVKEGTTLQKKTQTAAEERVAEVTSRMQGMAGGVGLKAGQEWDRLGNIFEERTAKALRRLGVPSAKDVADLATRIAALEAEVARLAKAAGPAVKAGAKVGAKVASTASAVRTRAATRKPSAARPKKA